ncbi:MAG: hypothetical protein AAFW47_04685 [Pseudomonadota bacterium]
MLGRAMGKSLTHLVWKTVMQNLTMMFYLVILTTVGLSFTASAQDTVESVLKDAEITCAELDNGVLSRSENAVLSADVTGDGVSDIIVDYAELHCSTAAQAWCGTGGCSLVVIVDGQKTEFLTRGWTIVVWQDRPIILLSLHGTQCNAAGAEACFQAVFWSNGGFRHAPGSG